MSKEVILSQGEWSMQQIELLKQTICKGANDQEFQVFLHVCKRTGLDPFQKQLYMVKRWDSQLKKETMTLQTGIDGYRLIADRTGKYAPGREPTFVYGEDGKLISATAYVKKLTADGTWHEVSATAFYSEYVQKTKEGVPTKFWRDMPHSQLAKCAEALALRKAFPADLSGVYTHEEMQQADNQAISVQAEEVEPMLSEKEIEQFYQEFNTDPELTKQYFGHLQRVKGWSEAKVIVNAMANIKTTRETYEKWKAKQKQGQMLEIPAGQDPRAVIVESAEGPSVFGEGK